MVVQLLPQFGIKSPSYEIGADLEPRKPLRTRPESTYRQHRKPRGDSAEVSPAGYKHNGSLHRMLHCARLCLSRRGRPASTPSTFQLPFRHQPAGCVRRAWSSMTHSSRTMPCSCLESTPFSLRKQIANRQAFTNKLRIATTLRIHSTKEGVAYVHGTNTMGLSGSFNQAWMAVLIAAWLGLTAMATHVSFAAYRAAPNICFLRRGPLVCSLLATL